MKKFLTVILILLLASVTAFFGFSNKRNSQPNTYYQVTLDGELIGTINSKKELEKYISSTEKYIKEKYDIDEVYAPNGLEIKKIVSFEEEIKMQKEAIDYYQNQLKCNLDENLATCGRDKLPANTAFYRPIISGYVTSEFGQRTFDYHYGIDLSTTQDNAPVYAAANGVVISVVYKSSCGGTKVYVHHNVRGQTYTTSYVHLREALVSKGDVVTTNTQIGVMGGNPYRETWDKCSTGTHLHFQIANGLYLKDYMYWSTYQSKSFNTRNAINLPAGKYNWFTNRTTKY